MKKIDNLFEEFCSFENIYNASKKAQKGKRYKYTTANFNFNQEKNIINIQKKLKENSYQFGQYCSFHIYEPKKRLISAAPYQDRVVHHAISNIIEPIFEKTFIYDLYSNRKNKGTHKAVKRYRQFCSFNKYVLKCDIRKYFHSMNKEVLIELISNKIKDKKLLAIIKDLVLSFNLDNLEAATKQGIPLGNLTSQLFANIYLNNMDHYIKEKLGCRYYIRYVDDFVVFDNSKTKLHFIKRKIQDFLKHYKIELHSNKSQVIQTKEGVKFLGYRIFPKYLLVNKENVKRFRRKLRRYQNLYRENKISFQKIKQSMLSWNAHAKWANSYLLRKEIFDYYVFTKG